MFEVDATPVDEYTTKEGYYLQSSLQELIYCKIISHPELVGIIYCEGSAQEKQLSVLF